MKINLSVSTQPTGDGLYKAVIIIGDFTSEDAALRLGVASGAQIADALHASKKAIEEIEKNVK